MDGNKRETQDQFRARMRAREIADDQFERAHAILSKAESPEDKARAADVWIFWLMHIAVTFPFKK